jgi:hypothetical protein
VPLIRWVNDKGLWFGRLPTGEARAVEEAEKELLDRPFASAFVADDLQAMRRISVALSCNRANKQHFRFVVIEAADLETLKVPVLGNGTNTPFPDVNDVHRDLDLSDGRARALIMAMIERGMRPTEIHREMIKEWAREMATAGDPIPAGHWLLR